MRPGPGGMRRNMLNASFNDETSLYNCYMPFLKNGGLFIQTDKSYKIGDEVFVLLMLMNDGGKIPVAGKVVWINPKGTQGNRPAGIGVHFGEMDKGETRSKIETAIANLMRSEKPTFTM